MAIEDLTVRTVAMGINSLIGTTLRLPDFLMALRQGDDSDELSRYMKEGRGNIEYVKVDTKYAVEFYNQAVEQGKPIARVQYMNGESLPPLGEGSHEMEMFLCRDCDVKALESMRNYIRYNHSEQAREGRHTQEETQSFLKGEYTNSFDNMTHAQMEVLSEEFKENGIDFRRRRNEDGTYAIDIPSVELLRPEDGSMNRLEASIVDASVKLSHRPTKRYLDDLETFRNEVARIMLAYKNYGERVNEENFGSRGIGDLVIFDACAPENADCDCSHVFLGDHKSDGKISFSYYETGLDRYDLRKPATTDNRMPPKYSGDLLSDEGRGMLGEIIRGFKNPAVMPREEFNREMERIHAAREFAAGQPDIVPDFGFSVIGKEHRRHMEGKELLEQVNKTCENLRKDGSLVFKLDGTDGKEFGMKEFRIPNTEKVVSKIMEIEAPGEKKENKTYLDQIREENELKEAITKSMSNLTVGDREKYKEPEQSLSSTDFAILDQMERDGDIEGIRNYLEEKGIEEKEAERYIPNDELKQLDGLEEQNDLDGLEEAGSEWV